MKEQEKPLPSKRRWTLFSKPLAGEVERLVKPVYSQHGFNEHRLLTQWAEVVGQDLARYSVPKKLVFPKGKREQGALHISVYAGRALELQHMQPMILERIATYFGYNAIERLVFTQDATTKPTSKTRGKKVAIAPDAAVDSVVASCEDEALRAVLASFGTAIAAKNHT
jgi:hypothetical protein